MMGFSQALAYYLGKNINYLQFLINGILMHSLFSLMISTILALFLWNTSFKLLVINNFDLYIAMGLSVGFLVSTGLLRGAAIAVTSKTMSSVISTTYPYSLFLILITVIFVNPNNKLTTIVYSNVIAALISTFLATIIILRYYSKTDFPTETEKIRYSNLTGFSLANLLIALLSAIIPLYTLYWLSRNDQHHLIGEFSVVIFLIALITTPINIISPYWYSRWAAFDKKKLHKEFWGWFRVLTIYSILLSFIFAFSTKELIYLTFGEEFGNAENASKLTGILSFTYVISRLLSAREMSQNNMTTLGIASTLRLITILILLLFKQGDSNLEYAAIAWISGEFIFILTISLINKIVKK
jgi:O-antigen/teichoic acid export membrane protein